MSMKIEKVSKSIWYDDRLLLYVDKMGTTDRIMDKSVIGSNTEGLAELSVFYSIVAQELNTRIKSEFGLTAFSDTIVFDISPENLNLEEIINIAWEILIELTKARLPSKMFVTRGDFGKITENKEFDKCNGSIAGLYGSAYLKAVVLEKSENVKGVMGVFIHDELVEGGKIKTIGIENALCADPKEYLNAVKIGEFIESVLFRMKDSTQRYHLAFKEVEKLITDSMGEKHWKAIEGSVELGVKAYIAREKKDIGHLSKHFKILLDMLVD